MSKDNDYHDARDLMMMASTAYACNVANVGAAAVAVSFIEFQRTMLTEIARTYTCHYARFLCVSCHEISFKLRPGFDDGKTHTWACGCVLPFGRV